MFLGKEEILSISEPNVDGDIDITFKGREEGLTINQSIAEIAKTEEPTNGGAEDAIFYKIAEKIAFQLADWGITIIELPSVVSYIDNLVNNRYEEVVAEKFGIRNPKMMKLSQIFKK